VKKRNVLLGICGAGLIIIFIFLLKLNINKPDKPQSYIVKSPKNKFEINDMIRRGNSIEKKSVVFEEGYVSDEETAYIIAKTVLEKKYAFLLEEQKRGDFEPYNIYYDAENERWLVEGYYMPTKDNLHLPAPQAVIKTNGEIYVACYVD